MEINYTMIGADGAQYGPITLEQLRAWINEGRVVHDTKILRSDTNQWLSASQYPELGLAQATVAPTPPPFAAVNPVSANRMMNPVLVRRAQQGARWFFWIAGLSIINSLVANSRHGIVFVVGLTATQFIDAIGAQMNSGSNVALVLNFIIAGIFVLFGVFAMRRQNWSFIAGMVLYALDAFLALAVKTWLGFGFHIFVLFWIFQGLQANIQLKAQSR